MIARAATALALAMLVAGAARAETVGLFAPSAPFPSTSARVEFATKLGAALGGAGKVYARAADFAAAVKSGEVTVALVDATYLAATGGNYTVIAGAVRGGEAAHGWQLVARGSTSIGALRGKHLLVPAIGGREVEFVVDVMFGGEIDKAFFAKIEATPDTASALAALGLGKADAALVPAGVELPSGAQVVLALPALADPVLVAYGAAAPKKAQLAAAAAGFHGDATIDSFRPVDADAVHAIARRFTPVVKRGPLVVPPFRLLVGDLVAGRTFAIERTPATQFAAAPK